MKNLKKLGAKKTFVSAGNGATLRRAALALPILLAACGEEFVPTKLDPGNGSKALVTDRAHVKGVFRTPKDCHYIYVPGDDDSVKVHLDDCMVGGVSEATGAAQAFGDVAAPATNLANGFLQLRAADKYLKASENYSNAAQQQGGGNFLQLSTTPGGGINLTDQTTRTPSPVRPGNRNLGYSTQTIDANIKNLNGGTATFQNNLQ